MKLDEIQPKNPDEFHFFVPLEKMEKSEKDGQRLIQGIASTSHRDLQGEIVVQKGIDYDYFLKHGYINDDHKEGPEHKVGEPLDCKLTKDGLWIKAMLYKGKERSDYWWEHINTLERNSSRRQVGFSIQGKIQRRAGSTIVKCWLQDVAITASPVNTKTWAEIVKSLSSQKWCIHPEDITCVGGCCSCSTSKSIGDEDLEDEDKALTAGGMGGVLVPESLEGNAKVQTHKSMISFQEAVNHIQKSWNCSYVTAKATADAIFASHGSH